MSGGRGQDPVEYGVQEDDHDSDGFVAMNLAIRRNRGIITGAKVDARIVMAAGATISGCNRQAIDLRVLVV